ncbi:hypothetical protein P7K49_014890 [Saguinus oedipus]|uniref:Uncharacterized protein n=1 Tax=Saguinus oedipus TaxID=9490 RepID=A0ABQ9V7Z4_SAGOE|nr:hypothetical protein P7K49_014890 [Saguinus oedipus]
MLHQGAGHLCSLQLHPIPQHTVAASTSYLPAGAPKAGRKGFASHTTFPFHTQEMSLSLKSVPNRPAVPDQRYARFCTWSPAMLSQRRVRSQTQSHTVPDQRCVNLWTQSPAAPNQRGAWSQTWSLAVHNQRRVSYGPGHPLCTEACVVMHLVTGCAQSEVCEVTDLVTSQDSS